MPRGCRRAAISWATLGALGMNDSSVFPITVEMTFDNGQTWTASTTLDVMNSDPTAMLVHDAPVNGVDEGSLTGDVTMQFTGATDPASGDILAGFTYRFDFDNDGVFDEVNMTGTAPVPASLLGDQGLVTVRGRIEDHDGGFTDYLTSFHVNEVFPTFTLAGELISG